MASAQERHQIAIAASKYEISAISDLPLDWKARRTQPMFNAAAPPFLSPAKIDTYQLQYEKLVTALNEVNDFAVITGKGESPESRYVFHETL